MNRSVLKESRFNCSLSESFARKLSVFRTRNGHLGGKERRYPSLDNFLKICHQVCLLEVTETFKKRTLGRLRERGRRERVDCAVKWLLPYH